MIIRTLKNQVHLLEAAAANIIYGYPSSRLTVVGVTGTDGKTTTTSLIYHILKTAGKKVAMISTVGAAIGNRVYDVGFHVTNPAPFPLTRFIKKAVNSGHEHLVLEVTSHGLDQNRVFGIPFTIGVLTNITHEHLDYHGTYAEYVRAKRRLLERSASVVLNRDDRSYDLISPYLVDKHRVTYGIKHTDADITPKKFPFKSSLTGEYNVYNCLAAICAARILGVADGTIRKALQTFAPPQGRLETVYNEKFRVIIDFAHTPNAFAQMLPEVRKTTTGRLIHVFGSAAKRDESKRPLMGKEASRYDDVVILTAEDPRGEPVARINAMIKEGMKGFTEYDSRDIESIKDGKCLLEVSDRKSAIELAVLLAKPGDTVLLTGKSHEKSMNYGHGEEPWDEFAAVSEAIKKREQGEA